MAVSQKCQYALRAVFELSRRHGQGVVRIADIAEAQAIPARFLEAILAQLKHAGLVDSKRGRVGGYALSRPPMDITAGDVIRLIDGELAPVDCLSKDTGCPFRVGCAFEDMWRSAEAALAQVYDNNTFGDLIAAADRKLDTPNYVI